MGRRNKAIIREQRKAAAAKLAKESKGKTKCYLPDCQTVVHSMGQTEGYQILRYNIPDIWLETQGEGITIAVLDTGCQTDHQDLSNSTLPGWNFHDNNHTVIDRQGHGTHVTGTIVANNNDIGVVGVAPKALVLVIKVLGDEGWGYMSSTALGILFAIEQKVDIISMSLGSTEPAEEVHSAIQQAYREHIPCICAAGNSGNVGQLDFPGRYPETISIGALNSSNLRAEFSQTGQQLDFMAPGVDINSTYLSGQYAHLSGTSMATPWAAGVVALMMAKHRKIGGKTPIHTVEDVRDHLKKTAIDLDVAGKDTKTGFGLIDVKKALEQIEAEPEPPAPEPTPAPQPEPEPEREEPMPSIEMEELTTKVTEFITAYDDKYAIQQTIQQQITELQSQLSEVTTDLASMKEKSDQIKGLLAL